MIDPMSDDQWIAVESYRRQVVRELRRRANEARGEDRRSNITRDLLYRLVSEIEGGTFLRRAR